MQKIQFCYTNLSDIKQQTVDLQRLLKQLFELNISKIQLLNSISEQFNYRNWAQMCAVNKSKRHYVGFQLGCYYHAKYISNGMATSLNISESSLRVCMGFLSLHLTNFEHMFFTNGDYICQANSEKAEGFEKNLLWLTNDISLSERHIAAEPLAAIAERSGMYLNDLCDWLPETGYWLKQRYSLEDDFVIMTNEALFWNLAGAVDSICHNVSFLNISIIQPKKGRKVRELYLPLMTDGIKTESQLLTLLSESLQEGGPEFPENVSYQKGDESISNLAYVLKVFERVRASSNVVGVKLLLEPEMERLVNGVIPHKFCEFICAELKKNYLDAFNSDFAQNVWSYESRLYFKSGAAIPIKEFWVQYRDVREINILNQQIHDKRCKLFDDPGRRLHVSFSIRSYWNEKFNVDSNVLS